MSIVLSTIIPIYNKEKALRNTLQSIVDNHEIDDNVYECILVDDESTDSCPEICKEFCQKYPYFKYIRIFNDGNKKPSNARNIGLKLCSGEFVHFLDSDDTLCKTLYTDAIKILESTGVDVFIRGYYISDNGDGKINKNFKPTEFKDGMIGPPMSACIFRNYVKNIKFKTILSQDIIFTWEALNGRSYYDDTSNFNSFVYHREYNEVNKQQLDLPFPKNVVKALQDNKDYQYELRDGRVFRKYDTNKIVDNGRK